MLESVRRLYSSLSAFFHNSESGPDITVARVKGAPDAVRLRAAWDEEVEKPWRKRSSSERVCWNSRSAVASAMASLSAMASEVRVVV